VKEMQNILSQGNLSDAATATALAVAADKSGLTDEQIDSVLNLPAGTTSAYFNAAESTSTSSTSPINTNSTSPGNINNTSTYVPPVVVQDPSTGVTSYTDQNGNPVIYDPSGYYGLNDIYNFGGQDLGVNSGGYNNFGSRAEQDAKGGLTGIAKLLHHYAAGGMPMMGHLGGYSDGGRLLRGPGDGVSDSIPASIGNRQPARLADGEFVVPARIVSELGNGSTEAGARQLYKMMDRIQRARKKTTGKNQVAANPRAEQYLPA